jgi:RIO-like serine/threonine protein kinase
MDWALKHYFGDISITPDQSTIASLIATVDAFGRLGVTHNNLDYHNILLTPSMNPTRAVVIDFGQSSYFREDESDEEWEQVIEFNRNVHWMKKLIAQKGWSV